MKHAKLIFNLVALFINVKYWTDGYLPASLQKYITNNSYGEVWNTNKWACSKENYLKVHSIEELLA